MNDWQRRTLGIIAIGGGSVGVGTGLIPILLQQAISSHVLILISLGIYVWGVWCGVLLLESASGAIRINRIFWAIQIPVFHTPIVGYEFSTGALINVYAQPNPLYFSVSWLLGSQFNFSLLEFEKPAFIGLNLFALSLFLFLSNKHHGDDTTK